ncbi:Aerobic cobaltochelatase subunit CobN [Planktothrix sp. PCC 11201]|uniref:cobaltochelatase subunit CobN n=1 Tax=Planktothrix sp. PCC 11201 TaxID=1729650 RepID=UPI0009201F42|nr:cobaltochelatase subunit CobN [Planktothrix sp. PCC 11201]SKB16128.1 Aerobic cobaltochelatase subunit CobN [Planktothrix sp. PCC 11201]
MHRIAATPGGWNPDTDVVIFIEQTPAPIIFLTAADTDIQTLATVVSKLPADFPPLRVTNLLQLQQQLTIDTYAETVLEKAQVIILRLLGGRSYWSYGLEVLQDIFAKTKTQLIILPGEDRPDPDLISHSTVSLSIVDQVWRYLTEAGVDNFANAMLLIGNHIFNKNYPIIPAVTIPKVGYYPWNQTVKSDDYIATVGIVFYRAHYLSGNLDPIDSLCQALVKLNLKPIPIFVSSLRDPDLQTEILTYFNSGIQLLINTTSFSISSTSEDESQPPLFSLDIPVLQVILSGGSLEQWENNFMGLSPRDIAMNVALPEVDGRIISRVVSFKAVENWHPTLETNVVRYVAVQNRINFVAELAKNWINLGKKTASKRRIAIILANYPCRDGRLGNGVGLDTPASCIQVLKALEEAGYFLENSPETGEELIDQLTTGITNDPEGWELRSMDQSLSFKDYQDYFSTLPLSIQTAINNRWEHHFQEEQKTSKGFAISGIQRGNIFIGIQPSRGYDLDPNLNYHAPDLEPTPDYLAFYYWLRSQFQADAIIHLGKHGNLEWLPGKNVGLSENCYPEIALGALPNFYPFIVNDPGEGTQAKRRSQAVILDHLTPPLTRSELYGSLQQLEGLMDEYYQAQSLDPSRLSLISERIIQLIQQENLEAELGLPKLNKQAVLQDQNSIFTELDRYLCELKEAQIRDGLHIFGQCPQGEQLRDLIISIARHPDTKRLGLSRAIAQDWQLEFDPLTSDYGEIINQTINNQFCRTVGDGVAVIEEYAINLIEELPPLAPPCQGWGQEFLITIPENHPKPSVPSITKRVKSMELIQKELSWIQNKLLPNLLRTSEEITNLLKGLEGRFIKSGASGAPTRGKPNVLPTGRNFYSVDIRAIPTETAWRVGELAASVLIERYTQENGEYPRTLGLSVWGTSTMRTGGDDIAEALALLGVKPVWDYPSRRVVDFEILPVSILGRPRVDVTLRISGFFRDAFPNLIDLFDQAVIAVSNLDETEDQNPLAAQVQKETQFWIAEGLTKEQANLRSRLRIFGSKPGAYGAGLQGLIESQNWQNDQDLATAYINWSSYAYTSTNSGYQQGISASEAFENRLEKMQIVLQNQDNREHDLLDSDDYYQFQGGMTVAVRTLTGKNPEIYFGDNAIPENPKVKLLKEEIAKVYRSRVINPKWIAGVMRHGYKGAFELSATVDFLFAYDVTANCVEDFMYEGVANAYIFDQKVQQFIQEKNPWALRDMAERLLEAHQRQFWQTASQNMIEQLRAIVHEAEGIIEGKV